MIRPADLLIVAGGAVALFAMMLSNPDYNSAVRAFVTPVAAGETGQTRLIRGQFQGWRTADRITFPEYGRDVQRTTEGLFLITDLALSGTTISTPIDAWWIGASGRRYAATRRIAGLPRQTDLLWLQPGLDSHAMAIFELPPDEVAGGALLLTLRFDPVLDGTLRLAPPEAPPAHQEDERLGG